MATNNRNDEARSDPIVEEIRRIRDEQAAKFDYNVRAIIEDAKKREGKDGRQVVSFVREKAAPDQSTH
jgi:hypothetical protein